MKRYFSNIFYLFKQIIQSKIFQVSFSCFLLFIVFRSTNISSLFSQLLTIPLWVSIVYILLLFLVTFITSIRWELLLTRSISFSSSLSFFATSMTALFYNLILPSNNGRDLVKRSFLPPLPYSKKKIIFSVFYDRYIGLTGLIFLGFLCWIIGTTFFDLLIPFQVWVSLFLCTFGSLLVFILSVYPSILSRILLLRSLPIVKKASIFLKERRIEAITALCLTIVSQCLFFTAVWIITLSLHFSLSLWQVIIYGSIIFLIASLPISFSGLGTTELAFLFFLQPLGVSSEKILALTTILVVYKLILASLGWIIGFYYQHVILAASSKKM